MTTLQSAYQVGGPTSQGDRRTNVRARQTILPNANGWPGPGSSYGGQLTVQSVERPGPDHVYINLGVPTTRPSNAISYVTATGGETRATAIVDKPSDYYLSVVRFNVPTSLIPIAVISGYQGQPNSASAFPRDNTNSTVTIVTGAGVPFQQIVVWTPESTANINPVPPSVSSTTNPTNLGTNPYFYLYSYQHWIDCVNTALAAANTAAATGLTAPLLTFNPVTSLVTLNAVDAWLSGGGAPQIWFNAELMEFFQGSFRVNFNGVNVANGLDYQMLVENTNNNHYDGTIVGLFPSPVFAAAYYAMPQEMPTLSLWTDFASLVFSTSSVGVRSENAPSSYIDSGAGSSSTTDNVFPYLTDFIPLISGVGTDIRQSIQYVPQGEYRLTDLTGGSPLYTFNVNVFWTDTFNNFYPLQMTHNYAVSIKVLFRRKGVPYSVGESPEKRLLGSGLSGGCARCLSGGCASCGGEDYTGAGLQRRGH